MKRSCGLSLLLSVAVLGACTAPGPAPTTPPATPAPARMFTVVPTSAPEFTPASSPADIVGVWLLPMRGQGGAVQSTFDWTIRPDGIYSIDDKLAGMHVKAGTYTISSGKLVLDSDECYQNSTATFYHCVGTYLAYCSKQGDMPVLLRLEMVDDKGDRSLNLNNKTLELDKP